jgi:CopA family copper-resistance protein
VIVEPDGDSAYSIFAQSIDRSGFTRGTLSSDASLIAEVPAMDEPIVLEHRDMGMSHDMSDMAEMDHSAHNMASNPSSGNAMTELPSSITYASSEIGLHTDMRVENPMNGVDDPGIGLRHHQHRFGRDVLRYSQLKNVYETEDQREPSREIQLHLTGNMNRYMWSINGIPASDASPIVLKYGERVRFTLVNDTMMTHPIHLHGMWSELETGDAKHLPRKHTIIVQPGSKISYLVTADALGSWAYHCHLLYHMPGMFRSIQVS